MTIKSVTFHNTLNNSIKEYIENKEPDSSAPLYKQIANALAVHIASGQLKPGDKLPTHRALADVLTVTVGTVTRAYAESERRGLLEARVGAGTYVRNRGNHRWAFPHTENLSDHIDFGFNLPPLLDRSVMLQQAMEELARHPEALNALLLYQPAEGIPEHRETVARWLNHHNIHVQADRLRFTSGAQNAMQLVLSAFCHRGDTILVEKLTYPGLLNLARQQRLTLKPVDMDDQGLVPEALDNACRQYNPRFIYATPTLQNPTTVVMGEQRRHDIVEVCKTHGIYLIEDQVNGLQLLEPGEPLVNMAPEQVIYISALSKSLAPGLRLGFLQAPEQLLKRLTMTIQNQSWMISPLLTGLACQLIASGAADRALQFIRREMTIRNNAVQEYLGEFGIQTQLGGFHGWLPLPEQWSLGAFMKACENAGVHVKSGELFVPPGYPVPPAVRIAFSAPASLERMTDGLKILRSVLLSFPDSEGIL
ncbi:aminotransferase-like domain-containing protein [Sansalvadorimonas verongulae]|uniref:aminotransferase-like domain-containing protein n=1 Tax=Sansalvadorimonas verongulae TaxID=2172824 RepID=UPI0012BB911F|nr:PLP-dependent aminotransferase family protein [Sansalvadorimonas verongulae]MTI12778.1 PLP-dependent aminotransferase family protein [Sansalvadorimonas verongulae]